MQHVWRPGSYWLPLLFCMIAAQNLFAQIQPNNHPELQWYTIETEHFYVHFHEGAERSARVIAKVAEDVYEPVTTLYDFRPKEKMHFIVRDHDDYSNGAAFYYDNKLEIWASALDFELRGTHNWLRNVVTHEFTHMIQMQTARKITRKVPAAYVQLIGYEKETRPDVLRGYPNTIVSYPLPFTIIPSWFAEGVAQYQLPGLEYDRWDSHRDMLLRTAVLEGALLSFEQMSSFGKNSIGNERAYNQGYSFVTYIAEHYGADKLREASRAMRSLFRVSFSSALKAATGKSGHALYNEWKDALKEQYTRGTAGIRANLQEGELIEKEGIGNFFPRWSPDGKTLAYLTTGDADYLSQTSLVLRDAETEKKRLVRSGVRRAFDWSPDGKHLLYSKRSDPTRHGSRYFDIYEYDLARKRERRLTRAARAHSPTYAPDGKKAAIVINHDGTQNLALLDLQSGSLKKLTAYRNGEQVYTPDWSPDGGFILFSQTQKHGRDLLLLNLASGKHDTLIADGHDNRDATYAPDGKSIYFASDRSGIFNIYRMNLATRETVPLTNVLGGAFMPTINAAGELAFSTFYAHGYRIARIAQPAEIPQQYTVYERPQWRSIELASTTNGLSGLNIQNIRSPVYDDTQLPDLPAREYSNAYGGVSFLPRLLRDYGTIKIGSYFYSSDVLNNYGFIGGFAVNRDRDYDLFALIDYNQFGPRIFLEAYNQVQHAQEGRDKFRYNLSEVAVGFDGILEKFSAHQLQPAFVYSRYNGKVETTIGGQKASLGYTYFIGRTLRLRYGYDSVPEMIDKEANPRAGRRISLVYRYNWNKFIDGFEINSQYGTLQEVYTPYNYQQIEADVRQYFSLPARSGLMIRLKGGYIDKKVDSFFYFFGGGLDGIRGYPYYAIEGQKLLQGTVAYRIPISRNLNFSFAHLYFDKLYFGIFADYGNAFNGDRIELSDFKRAVGTQVRLEMYSFYGFPTKVFFDAAYGLDRVRNRGIRYGKDWRFYFGVAFGFFD